MNRKRDSTITRNKGCHVHNDIMCNHKRKTFERPIQQNVHYEKRKEATAKKQ